jgi:plasmid maintenance system antidote protein VapI
MLDGAERLRDWVHRSRCSKGEAAQMLGIGQVYLSQLLHRKRKPGLETAVRIEQVTGISVESWVLTTVSDHVDDELRETTNRPIC